MESLLTVIIPCKDERANIRSCVASVRSIAGEILVADSGSTDGTLDVVRGLGGCRTIQREYVYSGDFKNWAIPQAIHPWILLLDADERVPAELAREIKQLLRGGPSQDAYWTYRTNHFLGHRIHYGDWGRDKVIRLFRRDISRYTGDTDHAEISVRTGKVGVLRHRLEHYSARHYDQYLTKLRRYTTLQAERWHAAGLRSNPWRLMLGGPFRFLRSYVLRLGFLDGVAGFHVSMLMAIYAYWKQVRLWELQHAANPSNAIGPTELHDTVATSHEQHESGVVLGTR